MLNADSNQEELIQYRLKQAGDTVEEVRVLMENNLFKIAVNRVYYGMFYMLSALAIKYGYETSKHLQLIGWFNKHFIKTGRIDPKYGKMVNDAFENRSDSDYGVFVEFSRNDVTIMVEEFESFITALKNIIIE